MKDRTKNKSSQEKLTSMIYENFISELWYEHFTVLPEIKKKINYQLISEHLFQKKQVHCDFKELQSNEKF